MNGTDVLIRQLGRQQDSFLEMVKKVPSEKLAWVPQEGMRSALEQFQEVATVIATHWEIYANKKFEWSLEGFEAWKADRTQIVSIEELEARLRGDTARLIEFTRQLSASELLSITEMPFPGEYCVVDNIYFHIWNMSYHEGQIAYILQLLGINPMEE